MATTPGRPAKSVQFNPVTGAVAIRTRLDEDGAFAPMAWQIATHNRGGDRSGTEGMGGDWVDTFQVIDGEVFLPEGGS